MKIVEFVENGMMITNSKGESLNISIMEFWEICRFGARMNTRDEVENYLNDNVEIEGYDSEKILDHPGLIDEIVEGVIDKRVGSETFEQIYWAAEEKVKEYLDRAVTLVVHDYLDTDESHPLKTIRFQVHFGDLETYLDEEDFRTTEEFLESYDNEEALVIFSLFKDEEKLLSKETIFSEEFDKSYDNFIKRLQNFNPGKAAEDISTKDCYYELIFYPMQKGKSKEQAEGMFTWADMDVKYPMDRSEMNVETEKGFVEDCFKLYEQAGFSPVYWSSSGDYKDRTGHTFEVIGRCSEENCHISVLPMWNIRFEDGTEIGAYPEEIIPSEMRANGCRFFDEHKILLDEKIFSAKDKVDVKVVQESKNKGLQK